MTRSEKKNRIRFLRRKYVNIPFEFDFTSIWFDIKKNNTYLLFESNRIFKAIYNNPKLFSFQRKNVQFFGFKIIAWILTWN